MGAQGASQGISGSLQDVAVADVLQFIHLGRRTGILTLQRGEERATIGFFRGRIISAQASGAPRLGDLLLRQGLVDRQRFEAALAAERQAPARRSLGQVLIAAHLVTPAQLRAVVEEQIRRAVAQVLGWETGEFEFLPDDLSPLDEVTLYPADVIREVEVDTAALLQQASEIFQQKNQQERISPVTPQAPEILTSEDLATVLEQLEGSDSRPLVHVLTPDDGLFARLGPALREEAKGVRRVSLEDALEKGVNLVLLLDARQGILGASEVATLRRNRPEVPIVVMAEAGQPVAAFLRAGASMVIPPEMDAAVAAVAALRARSVDTPPSRDHLAQLTLQRLRQSLGDVRSGFVATSLALNLLRILSESVARAVLLLVKEHDLSVLGAFGRDAAGQLLAQSSRGLRFPLGEGSLLVEAVRTGEVVRGSHAQLPPPLREVLGPAARDEVVVFPVRGVQRVLALVVADNGDREAVIADWEIVELAAQQAGMAFENELLRRKLLEKASPTGEEGQRR
ncbi:MAG: DUF4388 domain-containing protein [Thermoanaerobaculum sp.]|nr:DUF4388 domain-containing protein [Thermoanaerobaculum sp.]MDW7967919.1 DUF4388 domain-containing protein [Thermoanaerobaculum sp.]